AILDARAAPKNAAASLAQLYDPLTMPADLRAAHTALDRAVDRLYRSAPFTGDADRVEYLLTRYEALVNTLAAAPAKNRQTARRAAASKARESA
ncbi:type IIL restriction-modification enzyme MmeI, partial [Thermaurantiacus sp.]